MIAGPMTAWMLMLSVAGTDTTDVKPGRNQAIVAMKETAPTRTASVEHEGPYWSLGPVFALVRESMGELGEAGPMFVRFHTDPRNASPSELRSTIGFILEGQREPSAPFHVGRRPQEKVVYMLAKGPYGTTSQHYDRLYEWARNHNVEPIGEVVELYWTEKRDGVVEIQLPVRESASSSDERPVNDLDVGVEVESPLVADDKPDRAQPVRDEPEIVPPAPTGPVPEAKEDQHPEEPGNNAPDELQQHFEKGVWKELAKQVIPQALLDESEEAWLGQVCFRLAAVGRGASQRFGESGKQLNEMTDALLNRYREVAPNGLTVALGVGASQTFSDEQRATLRRVDTLMGRMSLGTISEKEATEEMLSILGDVVTITQHHAEE